MAAKALKMDELKLDSDEAKTLAGAVANVAQHYDIAPDPKVVAWLGLIGVVATLYGPRVVAIKARKAARAGKHPEGSVAAAEAKAEEQAGLAMVRPFEMNARG